MLKDESNFPASITREEYYRREAAGKITRPLTWGFVYRKTNEQMDIQNLSEIGENK